MQDYWHEFKTKQVVAPVNTESQSENHCPAFFQQESSFDDNDINNYEYIYL